MVSNNTRHVLEEIVPATGVFAYVLGPLLLLSLLFVYSWVRSATSTTSKKLYGFS